MEKETKVKILCVIAVLSTFAAGAGWYSWNSKSQELSAYKEKQETFAKKQKTKRVVTSNSASADTKQAKQVDSVLVNNAKKFSQTLTEYSSSDEHKRDELKNVATEDVIKQVSPDEGADEEDDTNASAKGYTVNWKDIAVMLEPSTETSSSRKASVMMKYTLSTDPNHKVYETMILLTFENGLVSDYKYFNVARI